MKDHYFKSLINLINTDNGGITKILFSYALLLVIGTMPFSIKANSLSIILLAIVWLFEGNFARKRELFLQRPIIWAFIFFYLLFLIGMFHTENLKVGGFNLEKKISLLSLPLLIGTSISYDRSMKRRALAFFVAVCLIASLICLGNGLLLFLKTGDINHFFHEGLTSIIDFHPPYFGMYISFSLILSSLFLKSRWSSLSFFSRVSLGALIIYLFIFVLLLSARTSVLFLILLFIGIGVYLIVKRRLVKEVVTALLIFSLLMYVTITQSNYLNDRIATLFTSDISAIDGGKETGLSIRIVKWKCSLVGIMEAPFFGTGTGDAVDYLVSCYEKENFWGQYPQYRFNSHNQYLETTLTLGITGLISLMGCLVLPFRLAIKRRDYQLLSCIALFSFCCLTESLLERQWGIVFLTLFVSILCFDEN